MPTPAKGPRLGGSPAHERLLLANLATALFEHGRITTTVTKAKRLRPVAEKLITHAKKGDLHARRQVLTVVRDKSVVHTLFTEIGPRFAQRDGGYTRITKLGPRKGDNAPMAQIELVEALTVAQEAVGEAERARGTRFRRGGEDSTPVRQEAAASQAEDETLAVDVAGDDAHAGPQAAAAEEPATGGVAARVTPETGGPQAEAVIADEPAGESEVEAATAGQDVPPATSPAAEPATGGTAARVSGADGPNTEAAVADPAAAGGTENAAGDIAGDMRGDDRS